MSSDARWHCVPLVFLMLGLCFSCSIKEDREICPCFLTVVRPDTGVGSQGEVYWFLAAGDYRLEGEIEEGEKQSCETEVPRTMLRLIAVSGLSGGFYDNSGFRIGEGENFPPVYYYKTDLDARCNSLRDTIRLHKNFSVVRILGDRLENHTYVLNGAACGFDWDGNILKGVFRSQFSQDETGFCCRVPRQEDSSLRLELYKSGELVRSFPIGDIISESGFDWAAEDLEDIEISLDYQETVVNVTVNGWTHSITFYYEF